MVSSFGVRRNRDNLTSMESSYEMAGMGKHGRETRHSHNLLVKEFGLCVITHSRNIDANYLSIKNKENTRS